MGEPDAPDIYYPPPSAAETALKEEQLAALQRANALQQGLAPIEAAAAGYNFDPATQSFTKMTPEEYYASLSPTEQQQYDIQQLSQERTKQALAGTLPVPADVQERLNQAQRAQTQQLVNQLGSGYATSTPGMQAQEMLNEQNASVIDAVRRGEMTGAQAISAANQAEMDQTMQNYLATLNSPLTSAQNLSSSIAAPISQYASERGTVGGLSATEAGLQNQRDIARAQQMSSSMPCSCRTFIAGGALLDSVIRLRDKMFSPMGFVSKGYEAMSSWIVPIMKRNKAAMRFVKAVMLTPIAAFCERYERDPYNGGAILLVPVCYLWTGLWNLYGRCKIICG